MSIQDLRKKLKPTPVAAMEEQDQQLDKTLGRGNRNNTSDYHKIDNGKNVFRIYPPHDSIDEKTGKPNPFAEPKVVTYIPAMVPERDADGKEIKENGKTKLKLSAKPVFNAKIHGKTDAWGNSVGKDAIEEFIRLTLEKAKVLYPDSEEERKKFCLPIFGQYSKDSSKRVNGIIYQQTWIAYADKIEGEKITFGRLELKKAVKNRLNKIAAIESDNEPLGTDPFTDLDEGRAIVIIYNKDAEKPEDYYTTEIDNSTIDEVVNGRKVKIQKAFPVTDEQLEKFAKVDSLTKIYRNAFTRKDLDIQITGLKMLDDKYKLGVFDTDEFQAILEELVELYPVEESTDEKTEKVQEESEVMTAEKSKDDLPWKDDGTDKDDFDYMNREELKAYIKENSIPIVVRPAALMPDDSIRVAIREYEAAKSVGVEEPQQDSLSTHLGSQPHELETTTKTKPLTAKERLEALKKQQQGS